MKNTFKKILSLLLVLAMLLTTALLAAGCSKPEETKKENETNETGSETGKNGAEGRPEFIEGIGGVSETFKGAVSEESYSSAKDAAEAFVENELAGKSDVEIVSATSKGELSNSEISALNLPADVSLNAQSFEKLEVEYLVSDASDLDSGDVALLSSKSGEKVIVYVIKYEVDWKYYTPAPITGKTITKTYYDSVFNSEKYENSTLKTEIVMIQEVDAKSATETLKSTVKSTMTQLIKHADGKVFLEQTTVTDTDGTKTENYICTYIEEDENGSLSCYLKTSKDGEWMLSYIGAIGFSSVDDLVPFKNQYLDYTYFTKTNYGFALEKDNAERYVKETVFKSSAGMGSLLSGSGLNIDMFAEYYVSAGVLSGMRMDADISVSVSEAGSTVNVKQTAKTTTTCTNYGTTVIERPVIE